MVLVPKMPIDPRPHFADLSMTSGQVSCYLTDCIWRDNGELVRFHMAFNQSSGGKSAIDSLTEALRQGRDVQANLLVERDERVDGGTYYYKPEYKKVVRTSMRYVSLPKDARERYRRDIKVLSRKEHEVVMYHENTVIGNEVPNFSLIMPVLGDDAYSEEEQVHHIFSEINHRAGAFLLAPEWTPAIWDWMQKTGAVKQLNAFGRFVGFDVQLNQVALRQFVTRELDRTRYSRSIFFPGEAPQSNEDDDAA